MLARIAGLAMAIGLCTVMPVDNRLVRAEADAASSDGAAGTTGRDLSWIISYLSGSLDSVEIRDPEGRAITRKHSDVPEARMYDLKGYTLPGGQGTGVFIWDPVEGEYSLRAVAAEESTWCDVDVSGSVEGARRCQSHRSFRLSKGEELQLSVRYEMVGLESCTVRFVQGASSTREAGLDTTAEYKDSVHLEPDEFEQLPREIRNWLAVRGFTVPQSYCVQRRHNVVHGEFGGGGEAGWAVLASRRDSSAVVVFVNGREGQPEVLDHAWDGDYWQDTGGGHLGYSRVIQKVTADEMARRARALGDELPVVPEHDGIEEIYCEKGSVIQYDTGSGWVNMGGSD